MKLGYPNNPRKDVVEEIKWIAEHFDFIDFFMEPDRAYHTAIDTRKIRRILNEYGMDIVGHTPYYLPFASPIEALRRAAIMEAEKCFQKFGELGAEYVTVHANWPPSLFTIKEGIEMQVESMKEVVERAGDYGIKVMYENGVGEMDNYRNTAEILRRVPKLYFHLDVGHAFLHGRDVGKFIRKLHNKLKHVHIHDNFGTRDLHIPIGSGRIKWDEVVKELRRHYDGTITLEIFGDRDYILLSKKKFEKMWENL
ncbi:MAG: sugar phosphate isomerase/epimerase [Thermoplasmata archaeon]|nr:sugar phosphate isomerase/epimerase [Thermoplasmata archaeon]